MVGTGNTAPTINDYNLESKISHGTGAGQLQYGAVTFGEPTCDASSCHFTITRDFSNSSGAEIVVYEIGLICRAVDGGNDKALIIRTYPLS